jgi:hypothetical protein
MPIHTPADTICTTRTPLRIQAPNRLGRVPPSGGLVTALTFLDAELSWMRGYIAGKRPAGDVGKGPDDRAADGPACPVDQGVLVLERYFRLLGCPVLSAQVSVWSELKPGSDDRREIGMTNVTRESAPLDFREHQTPKARFPRRRLLGSS